MQPSPSSHDVASHHGSGTSGIRVFNFLDQQTLPSLLNYRSTTAVNITMISFSQHEQNFEVIEKVGNGGYGSVYKVVNKLDERVYAIKKIKIEAPDHRKEEEETLKVLKECRTLSLLDHVNILRYYGSWIHSVSRPEINRMSVQSYESRSFLPLDNQEIKQMPIERRFTCGIREFQKPARPEQILVRNKSKESSFDSFEEDKGGLSPNYRKFADQDFDNESSQSPSNPKEESRLENLLYIQTEYCDTNLELYLEERGRLLKKCSKLECNAGKLFRHEMEMHPLLLYEAFSIGLQLLSALKYLHSREKLIHRDLKPTNIFMNIKSKPS